MKKLAYLQNDYHWFGLVNTSWDHMRALRWSKTGTHGWEWTRGFRRVALGRLVIDY